jgi:hypothetical protein
MPGEEQEAAVLAAVPRRLWGAKVPWMLAWKIQLLGFEEGLLFIVATPCRSEAIRVPVGDKL